MLPIRVIRLISLAAILLLVAIPAGAQTDPDAAAVNRAVEIFQSGDPPGALAMIEGVLAHSPEQQNALFFSALFNFRMNNLSPARGRLERLVKLSGNYFAAWELMVQVTQAQGDLERRNEAINRLKLSIATAIDPAIRRRTDFVREQILVGSGRTVMAVDFFTRGGSDFTRYQFALGDPRMDPEHGLIVRTDAATTEAWANTALMAPDKQLFHLDMVDPKPEGGDRVAIYQYYVGPPDYDTVRAKVIQILRGEATPISGEPGSLSGILK